jgi:phosphoglucosamine mutase
MSHTPLPAYTVLLPIPGNKSFFQVDYYMRLFGTDGARGIAMTEISCELAMNIGRALGTVLKKNTDTEYRPRVIIGRDTRLSSMALECALAAGLSSVGADVERFRYAIPTPAVAFITANTGAAAGVVISASHNTFEYNGIKIFGSAGFKLPDAKEDEIEHIALNGGYTLVTGASVGRITERVDYIGMYEQHVKGVITATGDKPVLMDCANGAAYLVAREIFDERFLHFEPDGVNVNDNCGSTHIERLSERAKGFASAFAFDGDADRCLAVDENGSIVNGDKLMAVLALHLKSKGKLHKNLVVATVMSNLGFIKYLNARGIEVLTAKVGDRYVLEEMKRTGASLGGEQSGHVILSEYATTGDGLLTAALILNIMRETGKTLGELTREIEDYPQKLINVVVPADFKDNWQNNPVINTIIREAGEQFEGEGRVLIRASGTEPLIRVMTEGKDPVKVLKWAEGIARVIEAESGK